MRFHKNRVRFTLTYIFFFLPPSSSSSSMLFELRGTPNKCRRTCICIQNSIYKVIRNNVRERVQGKPDVVNWIIVLKKGNTPVNVCS